MKLFTWYENILGTELDLNGEILPAGAAIMAIAQFTDPRTGTEYAVWIRDGDQPIQGRIAYAPQIDGVGMDEMDACKLPPPGSTRAPGHEGPCAAVGTDKPWKGITRTIDPNTPSEPV